MLKLNVNNETSKLKAVVLGIGNSLGSAPTLQMNVMIQKAEKMF